MSLRCGRVNGGQRLVDVCVFIIVGLWCNLQGTNAQIKCYFCMYVPMSTNYSCLMARGVTVGVPIVECPSYANCVIRSYFRDNRVMEFSRSCEVATLSRVDQCYITGGMSQCQKFCKTDLCNTGDGKVRGGCRPMISAYRLVVLLAVVGMLLVNGSK